MFKELMRMKNAFHKEQYDNFQKAKKKGKLIPQKEEGITDVRWLSNADLFMVQKNTFPLIKNLIKIIE